ncbi:MAG: Uma2 family endonuclease [Acidimicrobiia bacterium]
MVIAEVWMWDEAAFIRAWEAGVFGDQRVEMVNGEVWPVAIGPWHGAVAANVIHLLHHEGWQVTMATLPAAGSMPDPDAWVVRRGAQPVSRLGDTGRLARWSPSDVALVVEVADTSFTADTEVKARIYGAAAYPEYWVVHRGGVEVFTDPYEGGYRQRHHVGPDGSVALPHAGTGSHLAVADLLDAPP